MGDGKHLVAVMSIGFTGTQDGMTDAQKHSLKTFLRTAPDQIFIHGGCIGADEEAHGIALSEGYSIDIYPGVDKNGVASKRGSFEGAFKVHPEEYYLDRNKLIVRASDMLIATPKGFNEELRSGTWSTVRFARSLGRRVVVIYPDGKVEE